MVYIKNNFTFSQESLEVILDLLLSERQRVLKLIKRYPESMTDRSIAWYDSLDSSNDLIHYLSKGTEPRVESL